MKEDENVHMNKKMKPEMEIFEATKCVYTYKHCSFLFKFPFFVSFSRTSKAKVFAYKYMASSENMVVMS